MHDHGNVADPVHQPTTPKLLRRHISYSSAGACIPRRSLDSHETSQALSSALPSMCNSHKRSRHRVCLATESLPKMRSETYPLKAQAAQCLQSGCGKQIAACRHTRFNTFMKFAATPVVKPDMKLPKAPLP
eukprot:TRINITY_DN4892_c1_g1_i9.p1 TRINITY_DN4892_c1_g1~~TRINITY_DN4892_c1_g1_i9.p1  ORF type:complete len:131 (-),score=0.56 TRINITY_DN4892_c1_g1_i9:91-483(-)